MFWFRYGLLSWGGIWANLPRLEDDLDRIGWLPRERCREMVSTATLVPGPTYMSLAALVGYQVRGPAGAAVSALALMAAPSVAIILCLQVLSPDILNGPLAPVTRGLALAVGGILVGTAYRLAVRAPRRSWRGPLILAACTGALLAGLPTGPTVIGGFALGALMMREKQS